MNKETQEIWEIFMNWGLGNMVIKDKIDIVITRIKSQYKGNANK